MNAGSGKRKLFARILKHLLSLILTLLLGGFAGAALLRYSPGSQVDERDLDNRYSPAARKSIHDEQAGERDVVTFYLRFLGRAVHGDFGVSRSLAAPVSELIRARAGVTARLIGWGLAIGWIGGLGFATLSVLWRAPAVTVFAEAASGLALSLPVAVAALLIFLVNGPVPLVISLAIFPRVFRFSRDLFLSVRDSSQVMAARARGVGPGWIFLRYVARPAWAPLVALAGVCVTLAFGAAIPVEVVCGLPGLGELAWSAASNRDMPLLVSLTLIVTAITLAANAVADMVLESSRI